MGLEPSPVDLEPRVFQPEGRKEKVGANPCGVGAFGVAARKKERVGAQTVGVWSSSLQEQGGFRMATSKSSCLVLQW